MAYLQISSSPPTSVRGAGSGTELVICKVLVTVPVPVGRVVGLAVKVAVTGYGRASKEQVQRMVQTVLGLADLPTPDDAADALAVAICLAHSYRVTDSPRATP